MKCITIRAASASQNRSVVFHDLITLLAHWVRTPGSASPLPALSRHMPHSAASCLTCCHSWRCVAQVGPAIITGGMRR